MIREGQGVIRARRRTARRRTGRWHVADQVDGDGDLGFAVEEDGCRGP
jgi:hypothetical protein